MDWLELDTKRSLSNLRQIFGNFYSFKSKGNKTVFRRKDSYDTQKELEKGWAFRYSTSGGSFTTNPSQKARFVNLKLRERDNQFKVEYLNGEAWIYSRNKNFRNPKRIGEKRR